MVFFPSSFFALVSFVAVGTLVASACSSSPAHPPQSSAEPVVSQADVPPPQAYSPTQTAPSATSYSIIATDIDRAYDSDEMIDARRIVYRVSFVVPRSMQPEGGGDDSRVSTELHLDVSADRLRAKFNGTGWPFRSPTEIRLRADHSGAYVFDSKGGHPHGPRQLRSWFDGGASRHNPRFRWRFARERPPPGPIHLACSLFAELAGLGDAGALGCSSVAPELVRIGPWLIEKTADLPIRAKRRALRGDSREPPRPPGLSGSESFAAWTDQVSVVALAPTLRSPDAAGREIRLGNDKPYTQILLLDGVTIGWVGAGENVALRFKDDAIAGLPKTHTFLLGGISPTGTTGARPRPIVLGQFRRL